LNAAEKHREAAVAKGLELRLRRKNGRLVTSEDIFYGRHTLRVPRSLVISNETLESPADRLAVRSFIDSLPTTYNVTSVEDVHMVSTALALLIESRLEEQSRFAPWLRLVSNTSLLVLDLNERQRLALIGTTVEHAHDEMRGRVDLVLRSAGNISFTPPITEEEARWAVAVIMKHARTVHPPFDQVEQRPARMCLLAVPELLDMELSTIPDNTLAYQEEMLRYGENKQHEGYFVTQIARSDMVKGSPVAVWPGHLSSSELTLRFSKSFNMTSVGIGRNVSQPPNWTPNKNAPISQEYAKYNCTGLESFELRFDPKGRPSKTFVRCYRVSWFMANGWYSPMIQQRMSLLSKWPPPKKYSHEDWLSWTQADLDLNKVILEYCKLMKDKLDVQDFELHESLAVSTDQQDKLVAGIVAGERQAFGNCIHLSEKVSGKRPTSGQVQADGRNDGRM
jgi:hypothetical protein